MLVVDGEFQLGADGDWQRGQALGELCEVGFKLRRGVLDGYDFYRGTRPPRPMLRKGSGEANVQALIAAAEPDPTERFAVRATVLKQVMN